MATIPLGDGEVDIPGIVKALLEVGFDGDTTLEIAGAESVQLSRDRLKQWIEQAASRLEMSRMD
jgi:sugar phosphate isomerase/epimerase